MPGRKASVLEPNGLLQQEFIRLVHRSSAQHRLVFRARIILAAMEGQNNGQIADQLQIDISCVCKWRGRWAATQDIPLTELTIAERLADAPRPGKPTTISSEALCQIMALACQPPEQYGRAITHWTERELADEAIKQGFVATISSRHVGRFLKAGRSEAALESLLAHRRRSR